MSPSDSQQLIQAGWQLSRPCWLLHEATGDEPLVARWGGINSSRLSHEGYHHVVSIDCHCLPQNPDGMTGCLSIYTHRHRPDIVWHDPTGRLPIHATAGIRLSGRQSVSFPPLNAVVKLPALQSWITANSWKHDPATQVYCEDTAYTEIYQQHCPLYREHILAVLGGWHFPWPDNDWDTFVAMPLLVWTLGDAEPWFEVFGTPDGQFALRKRVT